MAIRLPLIVGLCLHAAVLIAADLPQPVRTFLDQHCVDCHDGELAEGGLDLAKVNGLAGTDSTARWVRIFDRVADEEMPPADASDLESSQRGSFLQQTSDWIDQHQRQQHRQMGRVLGRRLTNVQLERTLHDLLAIDIPLAALMPEEQRTDGFIGIADGQSMSHFQLESHLRVVDAALDEAFRRAAESNRESVRQYDARRLARENPGRRCRDPEMRDGEAVVWSSGLIFYGRITSTTVRESGWYRIKFSASSVKQPKEHGVWCSVRSGRCTSGAPLMSWVGSFEATEEPTERTYEAWIPAGHMLEIRPADATLKRARFNGGQVGVGEGEPQNVPGVALHEMTIERIHPGGDTKRVRQFLWGDLDVQVKRGELVLSEQTDVESVRNQISDFAERAFRRPISEAVLSQYMELYRQRLDDGQEPLEALRGTYRAVLCSPRFLYFNESPGPLDDYAIASRLSYMLFNSMPDAELFRLAAEHRLQDSEVLRAQVERMLGGQQGERFIKDFAAQWLDLMDIGFTEPDGKLYSDFDIVVQNSMLAETHSFLADLLHNNGSVGALVDSSYSFLNSRLARYYGIAGVDGDQLRRVDFSPADHRGGLMAHGSVLKVTANGTNTSPVLRGIWISERILGVPIPPPPESVPAIEPDIRGAKTIREQLEKHLSDDSCAGCHTKIDPPGYALENYDAAGQWRDRYQVVSGGRRARGAVIDSSATLADGRQFDDFREFRDLLLTDIEPIARNVVEKLLVYGTGGPITFSDREIVDNIVASVADQEYGFRSLIQAVVASPTFLNK